MHQFLMQAGLRLYRYDYRFQFLIARNDIIKTRYRKRYTWQIFFHFTRETTFVTSCLLFYAVAPSEMEPTLKGKNLPTLGANSLLLK